MAINYKKQLQAEVDAIFLYDVLAKSYEDPLIREVFSKLSGIEARHARKFLNIIHETSPHYPMPGPSLHARLQAWMSRFVGTDFILSTMAGMESKITQSIVNKKRRNGEKITGLENIHLNILQSLSERKPSGEATRELYKFEGKHKIIGGNVLRAAVLGINDGLVTSLSLVMGVAGATSDNNAILIAGLAGLLAGAFSMALGEWVSVQSAKELYVHQVEIEEAELDNSPEEEMHELILLYQAKGATEEQATKMAQDAFVNKETALQSLVKEELGINNDDMGNSPMKAALTSFVLFTIGSAIPLVPFFCMSGLRAQLLSGVLSAIALFGTGAIITLLTGRGVLRSGMRQVIFGLAAAAITYAIGSWIGVSLAG